MPSMRRTHKTRSTHLSPLPHRLPNTVLIVLLLASCTTMQPTDNQMDTQTQTQPNKSTDATATQLLDAVAEDGFMRLISEVLIGLGGF